MQTDTSGVHIWLILWKTYHSLLRRAELQVQSTGLCFSDFAVLEVLLHKGPLPVNDIGARVHLTSGSITAAINRLESRGLAVRMPSPSDGRARLVALTPAGTALIEPAFRAHAEAMESVAASLSQADRADLMRLLKLLGGQDGAANPLKEAS
jgi:MarR family transcriptional regulator, 2-MHQ and catechol-resistance regulon repressor